MEQDWAVLAQSIVHVRGPLTKGLTAGSFSDRLAPFTLTAWLFLLFWYLMFFAHEMYAAKIEPLLANGKSSSLLFQSSLLFYWFCGYVNEAMLLPVTLDFAASMGQSATMSGFFIGSSLIASILGVFMGKRVVNEEFWDQRLARALILWSNLLASLFMLLEAVVSNWAVHWSLPSKRAVFWVMMLLSQVAAFFLSLPQVPLLVMWGKFTPKSEMSFWMVLTQCARQGGVIAGPAVFALVSVIVSQGGRTQLAPCSLMAWAIFAQVIFGLFSIVLNSMVLPQLPPDLMTDPLGPIGVRPPLDPLSSPKKVPKPDGATTVDPERPPRSVEALERSQRREVVWGMIIYGFARYFVTTSIQMGTLMLLEVSYGLSAELSGAIFTVMCLSGFAVSGLASAVISRQVIDESALFLACNAVALLGVIFFFDFGTGAFGLLFATTVVYSCASLSNGIAEGWASRAAQEGTDFSNEAYRTLSMSLSYLASFMASVVARAFLDLGGRNLYAALQLVMVTLSTIIVYKVVSMTWDLSHEVTQNGKESGKEV